MSANPSAAASDLLTQIKAPRGAVNTIADTDAGGVYIRVLVDPMYWLHVSELPKIFDGYRVVVERRELTMAFH